jgi:hypothetical protein
MLDITTLHSIYRKTYRKEKLPNPARIEKPRIEKQGETATDSIGIIKFPARKAGPLRG